MHSEFVRVIVEDKNGKILMVCHKKDGKSIWNFPGGKIESFESPIEAAKREVLEETGLYLHSINFACQDFFKFDDKVWKGYFYFAKSFDTLPQNLEPLKLSKVSFYSWDIVKKKNNKSFFAGIFQQLFFHKIEEEPCQMNLKLWSSTEKHLNLYV